MTSPDPQDLAQQFANLAGGVVNGLAVTFAETGPIPNEQCALKTAALVHMQTLVQSGGTLDVDAVIADAGRYLEFLSGGVRPGNAQAVAAPAQGLPTLGSDGLPLDGAGQPIDPGTTPTTAPAVTPDAATPMADPAGDATVPPQDTVNTAPVAPVVAPDATQ